METDRKDSQDAIRAGMEEIAGAYAPTQHDKAAAAILADINEPPRVSIGNELYNRPLLATPDIAIWFGPGRVDWQIVGKRGVAPDLHSALQDIRLAAYEQAPRAQPATTDLDVQSRVIRHERSNGRGEPELRP
jgi:hypothetical protein